MDIMADIARYFVTEYYQSSDKEAFLEACDKKGVSSDQAYLVWSVIREVLLRESR